jgi:hypothetical protein
MDQAKAAKELPLPNLNLPGLGRVTWCSMPPCCGAALQRLGTGNVAPGRPNVLALTQPGALESTAAAAAVVIQSTVGLVQLQPPTSTPTPTPTTIEHLTTAAPIRHRCSFADKHPTLLNAPDSPCAGEAGLPQPPPWALSSRSR